MPTSFVPRPSAVRRRADFTGAFGFLMYGIFLIVFLLAVGVFFYGQLLASEKKSKDDKLAQESAGIDDATVKDFVQLDGRLKQGGTLLAKHVALSNFFDALQSVIPTNVRFSSLHLSFDSNGTPLVDGAGVAKNFNALAAASAAFSADGRIKEAIFSKISVNKDASVSFNFSAALSQELVTFAPKTSAQTAPTSGSATTTTP